MLCTTNTNIDTSFGLDLRPIYFSKMVLTALSTKHFSRSSKICIRQIADNNPLEWISSKFSELKKYP